MPNRRSRRAAVLPRHGVSLKCCAAGSRPRVNQKGDGKLRQSRTKRQTTITSRLRSEEHTSEFQSRVDLVCRLLLEKKKKKKIKHTIGAMEGTSATTGRTLFASTWQSRTSSHVT